MKPAPPVTRVSIHAFLPSTGEQAKRLCVGLRVPNVQAPLLRLQPDADHGPSLAGQPGHRLRQLDLAARVLPAGAAGREDLRRKNVPRRDGQVAWRLFRTRLLHDPPDAEDLARLPLRL